MSDDEDFNVEQDEYAGMEKIYMGDLRVGMIAMIKKRPCKIISFTKGKTGKHGAAKVVIKCTDIITDKHIEDAGPSSRSVWLPKVERKEFSLIDLNDNYVTLLNDGGDTKDMELIKGDSVCDAILNHFNNDAENIMVTVLFVIGEERIVDCRLAK